MKATGFVLLPLALAWLAAGAARADDHAEYNRQRARRLFLTSPSPYKTYSGYAPGYVRQYPTPYGDAREWRTPAYSHERITPRGYERYAAPSERGYTLTSRPVVVVPRYRLVPPPAFDDYYPPVP